VKSKASMPISTLDIEIAVARHFDYRTNIIVPNVSWGLPGLRYEADLVVLRPTGWAIEVEIKVSADDIRQDLKKFHAHDYPYFCELWFAVPESLACCSDIPDRAGILSVQISKYARIFVTRVRPAKRRRAARKFTENKRDKLLSLASMRTWTLKEHLKYQMNRSRYYASRDNIYANESPNI